MSKFKAFLSQFAFGNVTNRTKSDSVILIMLKARDWSKIIMLEFVS